MLNIIVFIIIEHKTILYVYRITGLSRIEEVIRYASADISMKFDCQHLKNSCMMNNNIVYEKLHHYTSSRINKFH